MATGIIKLRDYKTVNTTLVSSTDTEVRLNLNEQSSMFVSIFLIENSVFTAHFTTPTMVSSGEITINYDGTAPFSVFAFTALDGMENGSLGKTKWGVFLSKGVRNNELVRVNNDSTKLEGNQLIVVPISNSTFSISYTPKGRSMAEHGDLWLRLKQ